MPEETSQNASPNRLLDAVVVGAGQAGLAIAWHLKRQGLRFVVLEAGSELGHTWRDRWDSLKLFTPAQYDGLPGMPFPALADTYPTKDPVADYLQAYVTAFDLPVRLNARATSLTRTNDGFQVRTADDTLQTRQVVVATGPFQVPFVPPEAEGLEPSVTQVHSASYRNPEACPADRCWSSGAATPGSRSPRNWLPPAKSTCPSVSGHPCCPNGWRAGTCSGGSPGSACCESPPTPGSAGEPVVGSSSLGPTSGASARPAYGSGRDWSRLIDEQSGSLTAARYMASGWWSGRPATVPTTPGSTSPVQSSRGGRYTDAA
jgi:Pyridine nucleotide-disulphide oxidoreductase